MNTKQQQLSASMEDYLEAILRLIKNSGSARSRDIAKMLGVKAASVTGALKILAERKLINYAPYEMISLTQNGRINAEKIIETHTILKDFFVNILGVDEKTADSGACRLEHNIPKKITERLIRFMEFTESSPEIKKHIEKDFISRI